MDAIDIYIPFTEEAVRTYTKEDSFRVFLLDAPLSVLGKKMGLNLNPNLVTINAFHTGIGFQSVTDPLEFYFDYSAQLFGVNVFLPEIANTSDGKELIWHNQSFVTVGNVNRRYWSNSTYICMMNGEQMNQYQQWILHDFAPKNPFYQFLRVALSPLNRVNLFHPLLRSSICDDFCYDSFQYMQNQLNICINYMTDPFITILSSLIINANEDIIPLNYDDAVEKQKIIEYYEWLEGQLQRKYKLNESIFELQTDINNIGNAEERTLQQRSLETDDRTVPILILKTIEDSNRDSFILYTYNKVGQPQYFQINYTRFFIGYVESNLKRSYPSINLNGQVVLDPYTETMSRQCDECGTCTCVPMNQTNIAFYIVVFVCIFFFLLFLFLLFLNLKQ